MIPAQPVGPTRRRHTPEQILAVLREVDEMLGHGRGVGEAIAAVGVSQATFHRWRAQYGGIKADDARRLRELEKENRDLKSQVANQCLDIAMLRELLSAQVLGPQLRARLVGALRHGFGVSERRACEVIGQPRSSQRRAAPSVTPIEEPPEAWPEFASSPAGAHAAELFEISRTPAITWAS